MSIKLQNIQRRAANVRPILKVAAEAAQDDTRDGDAAIMLAAHDILESVEGLEIPREAWENDAAAAAAAETSVPASSAPAATAQHRHKYGAEGRCTVAGCAALSREAKRAAKAAAQLPGVDGAGAVQP
jgi:hypothetical protein